MNAIAVGIVDYGVGNHTSIIHSLKKLGCRIVVSSNVDKLNSNDLLILPGVGAFPTAASALHERGLFTYIQDWAKANRPLIGICLGMQLLGGCILRAQIYCRTQDCSWRNCVARGRSMAYRLECS